MTEQAETAKKKNLVKWIKKASYPITSVAGEVAMTSKIIKETQKTFSPV